MTDAVLQELDEAIGDVLDAHKSGDLKRGQAVDMFAALMEHLYEGEKHNLINFLNNRPYRFQIKRNKSA